MKSLIVAITLSLLVSACGQKKEKKLEYEVVATSQIAADVDLASKNSIQDENSAKVSLIDENSVRLQEIHIGEVEVTKGAESDAPACSIQLPPEGSKLDVEVDEKTLIVSYPEDENFRLEFMRAVSLTESENLFVGQWDLNREVDESNIKVSVLLDVEMADDKTLTISWVKECSRVQEKVEKESVNDPNARLDSLY